MAATVGAMAAVSVTSRILPIARPGLRRLNSARSASLRTVPATRWPAASAASVIARPNPDETPVMKNSFDCDWVILLLLVGEIKWKGRQIQGVDSRTHFINKH